MNLKEEIEFLKNAVEISMMRQMNAGYKEAYESLLNRIISKLHVLELKQEVIDLGFTYLKTEKEMANVEEETQGS